MSEVQKKGYHLVCPDFGDAVTRLSEDAQVRCLCYILPRILELADLPAGIHFEVIPLQWHHYGDYYPSIGMTQEPETESAEDLCRLSMNLGDRITEWMDEIGIDTLVELSADESLRWSDVLQRHEM